MLNERLVQKSLLFRWNRKWTMPNFTPHNWWECDLYSVNRNSFSFEYEVKLSVADFRADLKKERNHWEHPYSFGVPPVKQKKHTLLSEGHEDCPNRFYYVMPQNIAEKVTVPEYAGLVTFKYSEPGKWSPKGSISYLEIIKQAPKIHSIKVDKSIIDQLAVASNRRYLHLKFDDIQTLLDI